MSQFPKVRILHLKERHGLIRARLAGAQIATGKKLLIFLLWLHFYFSFFLQIYSKFEIILPWTLISIMSSYQFLALQHVHLSHTQTHTRTYICIDTHFLWALERDLQISYHYTSESLSQHLGEQTLSHMSTNFISKYYLIYAPFKFPHCTPKFYSCFFWNSRSNSVPSTTFDCLASLAFSLEWATTHIAYCPLTFFFFLKRTDKLLSTFWNVLNFPHVTYRMNVFGMSVCRILLHRGWELWTYCFKSRGTWCQVIPPIAILILSTWLRCWQLELSFGNRK